MRLTPTALALAFATASTAVEIPWDEREVDALEDQPLAVLAVDFDGDGDIDALSASDREDRVALFESDGADPPVFTRRDLITDAFGATSIAAADLDGDGDLDVLAAMNEGIDGDVVWFEQTPGASAEDPPVFVRRDLASTTVATRVRAHDLDGDGDLDVLFASSSEVAWLESDGAEPPVFTKRSVATTIVFPTDVVAGDLNGDGDLDLAATGTSGVKLAWFESDGATPPGFTERPITTTLAAPRSVILADVSGDQRLDVAVSSRSDGSLAWYGNDGASPPAFTEAFVTNSAPGADAVVAADLDFNGTTDLVLTSLTDDGVRWFDNDGADPPVFTAWTIASAPDSAPEDAAVGDLDGDGDLDVLVASTGTDAVVYYANELAPVRNLTLGAVYQTIAEALVAARADDVIAVASFRFEAEPGVDLAGAAVTLRSSQGVAQPAGGSLTLADGAAVETSATGAVVLEGTLTAPIGARASVETSALTVGDTGQLLARPSATLVVEADSLTNEGLIDLLGSDLAVDGSLTSAGAIAMVEGTLSAAGLENAGMLGGSGDLLTSVANTGTITLVNDTLVSGDLINEGTVTIQSGELTVLGALTGSGEIVGLSLSRGGPAQGLFVAGELSLGAGGLLELPPGAVANVGGSVDLAIDDASRFDLAEAELRLAGLGEEQTLEAMSEDLGAVSAGFEAGAGRFPIGTLRIGPTASVVRLVDARDNAPGAEAVYADRLVIEPGAELRTDGVRVYYRTIALLGTVDEPANLAAVGGACPADLTSDGVVGAADLAVLIGGWGSASPDLTGDGAVTAADLAALIGEWGPCS